MFLGAVQPVANVPCVPDTGAFCALHFGTSAIVRSCHEALAAISAHYLIFPSPVTIYL